MDYYLSLLSSSTHGIFQTRILEWVAISYSEDLPHPGIERESRASPSVVGRYHCATWEHLVGEWIHIYVYVWLSPFAVHLKLSQHC